jgi:small neutral amino acid transporter SnatA (MarC family)
MLFGSKIAIAIAVSKAKTFIENKLYIIIMRILGIALLAFSAYFFYDGLRFLGIEFF